MPTYTFRNLISHGKNRIEGSKGILEDHRNPVPADPIQLPFLHLQKVFSLKPNLSLFYEPAPAQQTQERKAGHALPAS